MTNSEEEEKLGKMEKKREILAMIEEEEEDFRERQRRDFGEERRSIHYLPNIQQYCFHLILLSVPQLLSFYILYQ